MFKLKDFKRKFLQSPSKKGQTARSASQSSLISAQTVILDDKQVNLLAKWLAQLNREKLITVTDQNDIVIMPGGKHDQTQQIFVNYKDVIAHMDTKTDNYQAIDDAEILDVSDIAKILLICGYVTESSGQMTFASQTVAREANELAWLTSIVRGAHPEPQSRETQVKLFDGENVQSLYIPYEFMAPTSDTRAVAKYLFDNGQVRYDVTSGTYNYRYVEPDLLLDEKLKSPERMSQHQMLSFHINRVNVDEQNQRVELAFLHDPNHRLILPVRWYRQLMDHHFDREYIIDVLLANGGVIDRDMFVFMDQAYSLKVPPHATNNSTLESSGILRPVKLSAAQKTDLIRNYVNLVIEHDNAKQDQTNQLLLLENPIDGRQLFFTPEHSQLIQKKQFERQSVISILASHGRIKQDDAGYLFLDYNNQYAQLPSYQTSSTQNKSRTIPTKPASTDANDRTEYHNIIDYMCRHGLVTWDKTANLIKLHFSDQTLALPINHLRSIVNPRVVSSSSTIDGTLPFSSRELSQWLINNSYMNRNTL